MGARARVARLGSLMRRSCLRIKLLRVSLISAHTREARGEGYHKTRALEASRTGVLADVGIGEVVRDGVVLRVVLCTSKEWVSIRRAWAHGCVGRTLSFSGDTGAPWSFKTGQWGSVCAWVGVRGCGSSGGSLRRNTAGLCTRSGVGV